MHVRLEVLTTVTVFWDYENKIIRVVNLNAGPKTLETIKNMFLLIHTSENPSLFWKQILLVHYFFSFVSFVFHEKMCLYDIQLVASGQKTEDITILFYKIQNF
jgi:hypothetical protein